MALNQITIYNMVFRMLDWGGMFKRISKFIFHHEMYSSLKRNKELVGRPNKSEKAYVVALGPSLKNVDLDKITGDTIVVNRFYKFGQQYPNFVPTYYIMQDYQFGQTDHKKDFRAALDAYLPKGTIFLLNSKLYGSEHLAGYPMDNIYFISCFSGNVHPNHTYHMDEVMPAFQNVVGASILSLTAMGYKNIILLGCDNSHFASMERVHCYKEENSERYVSMSWELFAYSIVAKQYDDLQLYAELHNIRILNSTKKSLIDSFPFEIDESLYKQ